MCLVFNFIMYAVLICIKSKIANQRIKIWLVKTGRRINENLRKISIAQQIVTIFLWFLIPILYHLDQTKSSMIGIVFVILSIIFHWILINKRIKN